MNAIQLWETAGRPSRAVLEFNQPVKYTTGRQVKTGTRFEAYLAETTTGELAYKHQPNARTVRYVPLGLIALHPSTRSDFRRRVDKVVHYIVTGAPHQRALDECFENYDGDQIVTAVIRRARKNPRLAEALPKWSSGSWEREAGLREALSDSQLEAEADQLRKIHRALFFWDRAQAQRALDNYLATL